MRACPSGSQSLMAGIELRSSAFNDHDLMPDRFSRPDGNVSPQLQWSAAPEDTAELVLLVEDRDGRPFAGRARELLERLLGAVGLAFDDAYLATVLKCRPPGNRDPLPAEIAACEPYLYRQLELVRPRVVAPLGSFATALLSGRALGITRVHGQEQPVTLGGRTVTLYPLYHPAAALYTPSMLEVLERDVARLPELLGREAAPAAAAPPLPVVEPVETVEAAEPRSRQPVQLGLF